MSAWALALSVEGLACRRGGRPVFSGVGFSLVPGEALLVTGRNGAGKSSLLLILAGLLRPEAGRVRASGIGDDRLAEHAHLAGHRDALKPTLTARESLGDAADLLGGPGLPPGAALEVVGLAGAADLPIAALSAGQRRRVALARLLVARRPLWLLDEPTAALDLGSQAMLGRLIRDHRESGGIVVAATHGPLDCPGAAELRLGANMVGAADPDPLFA